MDGRRLLIDLIGGGWQSHGHGRGRGRGRGRLRRVAGLLAVIATVVLGVVVATSGAAIAAPASTYHQTPVKGVTGVSFTDPVGCGPVADYSCTAAGYAGKDPWGYWRAGSQNASGYHNCTAYAAYRLAQNGVGNPGYNLGDASQWASTAYAHHVPVDQTPAPGAIAQWNRNHVAYVESVDATGIVITEDNFVPSGQPWAGGYTARVHINGPSSGAQSPAWPDNFIHFRDIAADLYFAKTRNTGSGHVEVHSATRASGYQGGQHTVTWFSTADQSNGWFQMVGADLLFIKTRNTGSGHVEVHSATRASGYQGGQHSVTWFSTADQSNGWFQMVGADLFFIKTRNTGSGRAEIHSATAASGYQSGQHTATWFSPGDQSNGWFQVGSKG